MDAAGITIQVLSAVGSGAESREGDDELALARSYNDRLDELVSAHPRRFRGFARIPMRSPQAASDELCWNGSLSASPAKPILDQVCITRSGFFSAAPFAAALAAFGPERILFSVDYPFSSMADGVTFLRQLPVSEADKAKIAHLNAERLLGIRG